MNNPLTGKANKIQIQIVDVAIFHTDFFFYKIAFFFKSLLSEHCLLHEIKDILPLLMLHPSRTETEKAVIHSQLK